MTNLLNDLALRASATEKDPGFTPVCVLTLALGIGANTAVFSVMNAVLLKSLPVADPQRVVNLRTSQPPRRTGTVGWNNTFSYPVYDALRRQTGAMSGVMAYVPLSTGKVAVRYGAEPEEAEGDMVSGNFFSGLGVQLIRGHGFTEQDEAAHAPLTVISYNYWTSRFSRNPDVLGKTFYVNGIPTTIIGITAEGFEGAEAGNSTDFWIPLQQRQELNALGNPPEDGKTYITNPTWWCIQLIGRLAPGITREQAIAQLQPIFQSAAYVGLGIRSQERSGQTSALKMPKTFPGSDMSYGKPLRILMSMVGLVLLIALSNVVMLLLSRNATRQREFSLRLALGARRKELFRQLLTESMLLVAIGGGLAWLLPSLPQSRSPPGQRSKPVLVRPHSPLFHLWHSDTRRTPLWLGPSARGAFFWPGLVLKTSSATSLNTDAASRASANSSSMQMALCVVLLVGAGLLVGTLRNLKNTPLGMRVDGLVVFGVKPNTHSTAEAITFYQTLTNKLRVLPGVESVTVMEERLGSWWSDNFSMMVDGKMPDLPDSLKTVRNNVVGPDFFHTLGVPILEGRDFADSDTAASPPVAIINELFAQRFLPNQNPLGHRIGTDDGKFQFTVVGVVSNHKYRAITEELNPDGLGTVHARSSSRKDAY